MVAEAAVAGLLAGVVDPAQTAADCRGIAVDSEDLLANTLMVNILCFEVELEFETEAVLEIAVGTFGGVFQLD